MIKFKSKRIAKEYLSPDLSDDLLSIICILSAYCQLEFKKDITLTGLYRTQEEQDKIYLNSRKHKKQYKLSPWYSVHQFWRGCDIRSKNFTLKEQKRIMIFLNLITYDTKYKTAKHHTVGLGKHFHLQTKK